MVEKLKPGDSGRPMAGAKAGRPNREPSELMKRALERSKLAADASHGQSCRVPYIDAEKARAAAASRGFFLPQPETAAPKKEKPSPVPETIASVTPFLELPENWDALPPPRKPRLSDPLFDALDARITAKYGEIEGSSHLHILEMISEQDHSSAGRNQRVRLICQLIEKFGTFSITGSAGDKITFKEALSELAQDIRDTPAFFLRISKVHLVEAEKKTPCGSGVKTTMSTPPWSDWDPEAPPPEPLPIKEPDIIYRTDLKTSVRVKVWLPIKLAVSAAIAAAAVSITLPLFGYPPPQRILFPWQFNEFKKFVSSCDNPELVEQAAADNNNKSALKWNLSTPLSARESDVLRYKYGLMDTLLCSEYLYTEFNGYWRPLEVVTHSVYTEEGFRDEKLIVAKQPK